MIETNKNTDPEDPENKGREPELIIPKMAFEVLGLDVPKLFKKQLIGNYSYGYEFHFSNFEEAKEFAVDVFNTATKPIDIRAYLMLYDRIVDYRNRF